MGAFSGIGGKGTYQCEFDIDASKNYSVTFIFNQTNLRIVGTVWGTDHRVWATACNQDPDVQNGQVTRPLVRAGTPHGGMMMQEYGSADPSSLIPPGAVVQDCYAKSPVGDNCLAFFWLNGQPCGQITMSWIP
jgi:hypothetical protein